MVGAQTPTGKLSAAVATGGLTLEQKRSLSPFSHWQDSLTANIPAFGAPAPTPATCWWVSLDEDTRL